MNLELDSGFNFQSHKHSNVRDSLANSPLQSSIVFQSEPLTASEQLIHTKALARAHRYREAEADVLDTVIEVDQAKLYFKFDLDSTYAYCLKIMKLTEAIACNFINVAKKSMVVPQLKAAIDRGELSVSTARKIVPVLTKQNCEEWINKAITLSKAQLEREIAQCSPEKASREEERIKALPDGRVRIEVSLSAEDFQYFRRAQDLLSGKKQSSAGLADTIRAMNEEYFEHNDPLRKAVRAAKHLVNKNKLSLSSDRSPRKDHLSVRLTSNAASPDKILSRDRQPNGTPAPALPQSQPVVSVALRPQAKGGETQCSQLGGAKGSGGVNRQVIAAAIIHAVNQRDQRRCQAKYSSGMTCGAQRHLHFHHIVPVQRGGTNAVENLITLCGNCQRRWHLLN